MSWPVDWSASRRLSVGSPALPGWLVGLRVGWRRSNVLGVPASSEPARERCVVASHATRAGLFAFRKGGSQYLTGTDPVGMTVTQEVTSALNLESTSVSGCLRYGW
jgi:hypothetical protein